MFVINFHTKFYMVSSTIQTITKKIPATHSIQPTCCGNLYSQQKWTEIPGFFKITSQLFWVWRYDWSPLTQHAFQHTTVSTFSLTWKFSSETRTSLIQLCPRSYYPHSFHWYFQCNFHPFLLTKQHGPALICPQNLLNSQYLGQQQSHSHSQLVHCTKTTP